MPQSTTTTYLGKVFYNKNKTFSHNNNK